MDPIAFLHNIRFRFIRPHQNVLLLSKMRLEQTTMQRMFQRLNTKLPYPSASVGAIQHIPHMSTVAIGAFITHAVAHMPPDQVYLNIGVWNGYSLLAGMISNENKQCIGVDNFSEFGGPRDSFQREFQKFKSPHHFFFDQDYKEYFSKNTAKIGVYFYDGDHAYAHQKAGLDLAHPFLAPGAIILIDDTNWEGPRKATEDFISEHGDTYEVVFDVSTAHNKHITFWNGLMVLRKRDEGEV